MEGACLTSCGGGVLIVLEMPWAKGGEGHPGIDPSDENQITKCRFIEQFVPSVPLKRPLFEVVESLF